MTTDGNRRHPGWPDYVGPTAAWCLLPHHDILCAWCHNIPGRWREILHKGESAARLAVRARHFFVLEEAEIPQAVRAAWGPWEQALREVRLIQEALLVQYVPDHRWNGKEIVFPSEV